jgi:serine/threonine protein kinase/WD40 repeat protein
MDVTPDRFREIGPDRFAQIRRIFEAAAELHPDRRGTYLDKACGDDPGLRMEVERLLEAADQSFSMLDRPAVELQSEATIQQSAAAGDPADNTISHYRLVSRLGRGGMGIVYRAVDTRLEREVALKFLPDHLVQDPASLDRFRREARAASCINHPHICTVHDVGEQQGKPFLVMELLRGETLRERLARGRIAFTELVEWCLQIADALEAAHNAGIIHRDIKPANIFVTDRGQAKVLDFGLARSVAVRRTAAAGASDRSATSVDLDTSPGQIRGTVLYMSPEQARGEELDRRTDIFSLGIVMYEMATGKVPFSAATSALIFDAILNREPPSVLERDPSLPPELDRIVTKSLEKNRKFRYQSAADLIADLERLKRDTSSRVPAAAGGRSRTIRSVARTPWFVGTMLTLVAGLVWFSWRWVGHSAAAPQQQISMPIAITTYPGAEEDATLSSDGNQVAFSGNVLDDDNFDIYVKVIGSESLLRLTQDRAADIKPVWSPDGKWIAFQRAGKLFLIPPLGGSERLLAEGIRKPEAWSRDSKWLIATTFGPAETGALIRISVETGEHSQLSPENDVAFASISPDGRKLLYVREDRGQVQFLAAPFTTSAPIGAPRRLDKVSAQGFPFGCAWTQDNRDAICALRKSVGQQPNLWRIDTQNERPPELVPFTEGASAPSISVAGTRLAYDRFQSNSDLWRIKFQKHARVAGEPERFLSSTQYEAFPEYSPDGSRIAFLSSRSGAFEIWIANADGSNLRLLTSRGVSRWSPKWSPDGGSITFASEGELYTIAAAGGLPIQLQHGPAENVESPSYAGNGEWIYFIGKYRNGEKQIWRVRSSGGTAERLGGKGAITAMASPDGQHVFYTKRDPAKCTVWRMREDGTQDELMIDSDPTVEYALCPQFTFAQRGIFYIPCEHADQMSRVMLLDLKQNVSRVVLTLGKKFRFTSQGLSVSPDGQSIIYAGYDYQGDLMLIDPFR